MNKIKESRNGIETLDITDGSVIGDGKAGIGCVRGWEGLPRGISPNSLIHGCNISQGLSHPHLLCVKELLPTPFGSTGPQLSIK